MRIFFNLTNFTISEGSVPLFPKGKMFIVNSLRIILWWFGLSRILNPFLMIYFLLMDRNLSSLDSEIKNDMFSLEKSESLMRPIWFLYFSSTDRIEARSIVEIAKAQQTFSYPWSWIAGKQKNHDFNISRLN